MPLTLGGRKGKIKVCHRLTFLSFLSPSEIVKILTKSNVSWSQTVVEQLTHDPKLKDSNKVIAATGRGENKNKSLSQAYFFVISLSE